MLLGKINKKKKKLSKDKRKNYRGWEFVVNTDYWSCQ